MAEQRNVSFYLRRFAVLNCAKSPTLGEAPHKPILLLSLIQMFEENAADELITITPQLEQIFEQTWSAYVRTKHRQNLAMPFYHMRSEGFWQIDVDAEYRHLIDNKNKMKNLSLLKTINCRARIDSELAQLLRCQADREALKGLLLARYFYRRSPKTNNGNTLPMQPETPGRYTVSANDPNGGERFAA